ncbi:hypothetical protein HYN69_05975 [Gemmobacter aquarius]|uniref:Uncharacterized protein n=2 Tax=Paragemmobacter aquarius TaxID=2169400 RepID=A0A2S0UK03_9RHOB|nr:hypothetical protein HYN69_05975 [Gemmobacter aquarius]
MRKTQLLGPSQQGASSRPVFSTANWAPITLFALAYVAILGVLFAPEGYFNGEEPATLAAD